LGFARIDHATADEIRRSTWNCEQRRADESTGGRLRDAEGFLPRLQPRGDALGDRDQRFHAGYFFENSPLISPPFAASASPSKRPESARGFAARINPPHAARGEPPRTL